MLRLIRKNLKKIIHIVLKLKPQLKLKVKVVIFELLGFNELCFNDRQKSATD